MGGFDEELDDKYGKSGESRYGIRQLWQRRKRLFIAVSIAILCWWFFFTQRHAQADVPRPSQGKVSTKQSPGSEKATLVMLARNEELAEVLRSMRQVEDRFNRKYAYTWTFMNDKPFDQRFVEYTSGLASGRTKYARISKREWSLPSHIDEDKMRTSLEQMVANNVIYGGSVSYRHMCRFNSGFFFRQPALDEFDYYWRVEPGVTYGCDVDYDPFTFMRENNKKYGFVITFPEYFNTMATLWQTTQDFFRTHPEYIAANNSLPFIVDGKPTSAANDEASLIEGAFNGCHFWSNFEIGDLNFWRSRAYRDYFDHLDAAGGFYYERWGDAPVHTLAAAILLPRSQIHHFSDISYYHPPWGRCPADEQSHASGRCVCEREHSFDNNDWSCLPKWTRLVGLQRGQPGWSTLLPPPSQK